MVPVAIFDELDDPSCDTGVRQAGELLIDHIGAVSLENVSIGMDRFS